MLLFKTIEGMNEFMGFLFSKEFFYLEKFFFLKKIIQVFH